MRLFNLAIFLSICMVFFSISGLSFYKSTVAAGHEHTVLIDENGCAWVVGHNDCGQLGLGDNTNRNTFHKITIENHPNLFTCAAAGKSYTILIDMNGHAWAVGDNSFGQLGLGDKENRTTFQKITIENHSNLFTCAAAGDTYTILIDVNGYAWAVGDNEYGQLGLGDKKDRTTFQKITIESKSHLRFRSAVVGFNHTILIDENGHAWAVGNNSHGQLGLKGQKERTIFQQITIENHPNLFTCAAAGDSYTILIDENGHAWAVGYNDSGQLGLGDTKNRTTFQQIIIKNQPHLFFTYATAGFNYTILIDEFKQPWAVGDNDSGQLALGYRENRTTFQKTIIESQLLSFTYAAAGFDDTVLIDENGHAWVAGNGNYGNLELSIQQDGNLHPIMVDEHPLRVMSPFQKTRVKSAKSDEY